MRRNYLAIFTTEWRRPLLTSLIVTWARWHMWHLLDRKYLGISVTTSWPLPPLLLRYHESIDSQVCLEWKHVSESAWAWQCWHRHSPHCCPWSHWHYGQLCAHHSLWPETRNYSWDISEQAMILFSFLLTSQEYSSHQTSPNVHPSLDPSHNSVIALIK